MLASGTLSPVASLSGGIVWARDDSCNNACAGKARSRGTRCRDVIFETLFETLGLPKRTGVIRRS